MCPPEQCAFAPPGLQRRGGHTPHGSQLSHNYQIMLGRDSGSELLFILSLKKSVVLLQNCLCLILCHMFSCGVIRFLSVFFPQISDDVSDVLWWLVAECEIVSDFFAVFISVHDTFNARFKSFKCSSHDCRQLQY